VSARTLTILSLYPKQLGINGDSGNVLALVSRAEWRGVDVTVLEHAPGAELPESVDLIHIGSGPRTAQLAVQADLAAIAPRLREWKAAGVPVVAIAGGWQLLGTSIEDESGVVTPGAGLFDSSAVLVAKRAVSEIVLTADGGRIAGFENHGAVVTLGSGASPLGTLVAGIGHAGVAAAVPVGSAVDGIVEGASIGTNLHGPFLPMNPAVADRVLTAALTRAGFDGVLAEDERVTHVDEAATNARAAIAGRLGV
jgi:CobQ-like glutamine amidotransferase family enzyme